MIIIMKIFSIFSLTFIPFFVLSAEPVKVTITGNDTMQFDLKSFEVESGQKIELTFKNIGKIPKIAMGHNLVILNKDVDVKAFATSAIAAKATDYIPEGSEDKVLAMTKLIGGGESDTIEFVAPEAGTYEFICTFPGHYMMMKGILVVE